MKLLLLYLSIKQNESVYKRKKTIKVEKLKRTKIDKEVQNVEKKKDNLPKNKNFFKEIFLGKLFITPSCFTKFINLSSKSIPFCFFF